MTNPKACHPSGVIDKSYDNDLALAKAGQPAMEVGTWHTTPATDLEAAIADFKAALPGWWYSVCECQVSCDASCAPTTESPHIALIESDERGRVLRQDDPFDSGFHADLPQPSSLADALRNVMRQALDEIAARAALQPQEASE